jgi:pectate lyase
MKLSKEEFIKKVNEMEIDEDKKIELMEDITDSFVENNDEYENFKAQYEQEKADLEAQIANEKAYITELKNRYKERFLSPIDDKEDKKEEIVDEDVEEKIVDIKEI